ncbi:MAG: hypothetical protein ACO3NZ_00130 [Pirellulales bacterium]|jgi:hypothetical protein
MHAFRFVGLPSPVLQAAARPRRTIARLLAAVMPFVAVVGGLLPQVSVAEDSVGVLITGPLLAAVGEKLSFEVELVNRSGKPLSGLRIVDYFDEGFRHEASLSPIEQKGTVDLAVGTSRRITLEFIAAGPGRQCHRVEILDPSHQFVGGATACVEVSPPPQPTTTNTPAVAPTTTVPPPATSLPATPPPASAGLAPPSVMVPPVPTPAAEPVSPAPATPPDLLSPAPSFPAASSASPAALEMEITGPTERKHGELADFIATVHNTGQVASSGGTLELSWDQGFVAAEASDGYVMGSDKVSWDLPPVEPGGKLRRQINLRLPASPPTSLGFRQPRLCIRGVLSGVVGGVLVADECCVAIAADTTSRRTMTDAGLRLTLADCDDPVQIGSSTTLICTIRNEGTSSTGLLNATILLPEQAKLVGDPSPSRVRIDGRTVSFDGIPSLAPGNLTTLELAIRLPASGRWKSEVVLTGDELEGSVTGHAETTALTP